MELIDIVLYAMYLAFAVSLASVSWSAVRRYRRGTGRLAVQNGIKAHRLSRSVGLVLIAIVIFSRAAGDGSAVDVVLATLVATIVWATLVTVWSFLKRR